MIYSGGAGVLIYKAAECFSQGRHYEGAVYAGIGCMLAGFSYSFFKETAELRANERIIERLDGIEKKLGK